MRIHPRGAVLGCSLIAALLTVQTVRAQTYDPWGDRYRNGRYDAYTRPAHLEAGTFVTVRTRQTITADRQDNRVFTAIVDQDVWDQYSRLAVPVIPRGSPATLQVRTAPDGDLILDLDSVTVEGRRYTVGAQAQRIEGRPQGTAGNRAPEYIGGGALLGTIIGAIAGGGKGAAIGAAAGAGAGAAGLMATSGRSVRVPAESALTFRLDRELTVNVANTGHRRDDNRR